MANTLMVIFTGIIALATILYVVFTVHLWKATKQSADAAKLNADALVNSERAWVMAELGWYEGGTLRISEAVSGSPTQGRVETTTANVKLICRNEGKSPAWIDRVYGHLEIARKASLIKPTSPPDCQGFGPMGPLGVGMEQSRALQLECPGHRRNGQFLSAYVIVEYHDVFALKRETFLGYSIDTTGEIYRQDALPERNRNT